MYGAIRLLLVFFCHGLTLNQHTIDRVLRTPVPNEKGTLAIDYLGKQRNGEN